MIQAGLFAGVAGGPARITITGSLSATALAGVATSAAVSLTIQTGSSGQIAISFSDVGTVLGARYSKNGGAFTAFADGDFLTFANGDTLALRTNGCDPGESRTYTLTDVTAGGSVIATAVHSG